MNASICEAYRTQIWHNPIGVESCGTLTPRVVGRSPTTLGWKGKIPVGFILHRVEPFTPGSRQEPDNPGLEGQNPDGIYSRDDGGKLLLRRLSFPRNNPEGMRSSSHANPAQPHWG